MEYENKHNIYYKCGILRKIKSKLWNAIMDRDKYPETIQREKTNYHTVVVCILQENYKNNWSEKYVGRKLQS